MLRKKSMLLLLAILLIFAVSCLANDSGSNLDTTYDIFGIVTVEGTPLEVVTITIDDGSTAITKVTDTQGQWSAAGLMGKVKVTAAKDGYSFSQQYEVDSTSQLPFNAFPVASSEPSGNWIQVSDYSTEGRIYDVAWSPDGQRLAFSTQLRVVYIADTDTDTVQVLTESKSTIPAIDTLAWSYGGKMLALSGWYPEVLIWNLTEDIPVLTTVKIGLFQGTRRLAWSPDSSKFAISFSATVGGETVRLLEIWDAATGQKLQAAPGTGYGKPGLLTENTWLLPQCPQAN